MQVTEKQIEAAKKASPPFWRSTDNCEKHIKKMLHAALSAIPLPTQENPDD